MAVRIYIAALTALTLSGYSSALTENADQPTVLEQPPVPEEAPEPSPPSLDLSRLTAPVAILETLEKACQTKHASGAAISGGEFSESVSGISPILESRLSARPLPGEVWTVQTLETPILIGTVSGNPKACQIIATSPFGDVLKDNVIDRLSSPIMRYVTYQSGEMTIGVNQTRLKKDDALFIDVLTYQANNDRPTTVHVIFQ
ncbi:MAG: hypothetical protein AAF296_08425 [Pseudomonadota bacterium]